MLSKNDVEHINTRLSFKFRCKVASVFREKASCDRSDGLAPTYGLTWACCLANRALEIMILRIETSINNIFVTTARMSWS